MLVHIDFKLPYTNAGIQVSGVGHPSWPISPGHFFIPLASYQHAAGQTCGQTPEVPPEYIHTKDY